MLNTKTIESNWSYLILNYLGYTLKLIRTP